MAKQSQSKIIKCFDLFVDCINLLDEAGLGWAACWSVPLLINTPSSLVVPPTMHAQRLQGSCKCKEGFGQLLLTKVKYYAA